MSKRSCQAENPETCRYHGQRNILHELRDKAQAAAEEGNTAEYLKIKERADIIATSYEEAENRALLAKEQYLHVNGKTNENELTMMVRANSEAEYVIAKAFDDYHASTYEEKKQMLEAQLNSNGGKTETVALFDLEGNRLPAKLIPVANKYSGEKELVWGIIEGNDPSGRVKEWFKPSKAKNEQTAKQNNERKGYYVGKVLAPATIKKVTHSSVATSSSWPEIVPRWDTPFDSEEIKILDNGK